MTLKPETLEQLRKRRATALEGGGADKIKERHAKGLLTARERLEMLFQPGTFQEIGMHVQHAAGGISAWRTRSCRPTA